MVPFYGGCGLAYESPCDKPQTKQELWLAVVSKVDVGGRLGWVGKVDLGCMTLWSRGWQSLWSKGPDGWL